jgi:hypothetical protein
MINSNLIPSDDFKHLQGREVRFSEEVVPPHVWIAEVVVDSIHSQYHI